MVEATRTKDGTQKKAWPQSLFETQRLPSCGLDTWAEGTPEAKIPT